MSGIPKQTCLDHNCAPVCLHIPISPTREQQIQLWRLIMIAHNQSEITDEVKDDLINMVMKRGPYQESR